MQTFASCDMCFIQFYYHVQYFPSNLEGTVIVIV